VSVLKTRAWPYLVLAAVIFIVGQVVLDGPIAGLVAFVGVVSFIGACLRRLRGTVHDVEGMEKATRGAGIIGGGGGG
jgi:hypothetical protein